MFCFLSYKNMYLVAFGVFLNLFSGCLPGCDYIVMKLSCVAVWSKFIRLTIPHVSLLMMIIYSPNIIEGFVCAQHSAMIKGAKGQVLQGRETHAWTTLRWCENNVHGVIARGERDFFLPEGAWERFLAELMVRDMSHESSIRVCRWRRDWSWRKSRQRCTETEGN